MNREEELFQLADNQQGYFTCNQAETCGYARSNFHLKLKSGEWTREMRGIYRLARYPFTQRPELVLWSLWSCNAKGIPQGVWSHETALDIHEMSDVMPKRMHLSVPKKFRKGTPIPKILHLHYEDISETDLESHQGYRVTTPLKTLRDVIQEGKVPREQIIQAFEDALRKGLLSPSEIRKLRNTYAI